MTFDCKEISISDRDFGCIIKLSDRVDRGYVEGQTFEEMINSSGKYLLIQRSYPEDSYENDYYTVETSEYDEVVGQQDKLILSFAKDKRMLKAQFVSLTLEIGLRQIESGQIQKLVKKLRQRFKGKVIINE